MLGPVPDLIRTPVTADLVRGALELEPTSYGVLPHRLPTSARQYADPQLAMAESHADFTEAELYAGEYFPAARDGDKRPVIRGCDE